MAKLAIKKASTDVTVYLFIQASNVTTGAGLTGLTFETASLVASYVRPLAARAALSLATQTVDGAHSDGGFVEVDATNMPGVYRLDLPDAVCATGVPSVVVMLKGAANMAPVLLEIQLTDFDLNDASPNVTVNDMATDSLTAAALKADAVTEIQNGLALEATLTAIKGGAWTTGDTIANINFAISLLEASLSTIDNFLDTEIAAILADTNELQTDLVNGGRLDLLIDAIKAKTDQFVFTIPNKVDATATVDPTGIATSAALAIVDANVDAIKVKTDALDNSAVTFVTAVNGSTITILRGDTLSGSLTDLGDLTDYVSIDFTVKESYSQTDDEAIIRIRKNASGADDGLLRFNGAAASSSSLGSITIDDLASGDITIELAASCTDDLSTGSYVYDVQLIEVGDVSTLTSGKATVTADVTRAVA